MRTILFFILLFCVNVIKAQERQPSDIYFKYNIGYSTNYLHKIEEIESSYNLPCLSLGIEYKINKIFAVFSISDCNTLYKQKPKDDSQVYIPEPYDGQIFRADIKPKLTIHRLFEKQKHCFDLGGGFGGVVACEYYSDKWEDKALLFEFFSVIGNLNFDYHYLLSDKIQIGLQIESDFFLGYEIATYGVLFSLKQKL